MRIKGMTTSQLIAYVQSKVHRSYPPDQVQKALPGDPGSGTKSIVAEETLPAGHLPLPPKMPVGFGFKITPTETGVPADPSHSSGSPDLIPVPQDDEDGLAVEVGATVGLWLMNGMMTIKRTEKTRELFEQMEEVTLRGNVKAICQFFTSNEAVLRSLGFDSEQMEKLLDYVHGRETIVPPPFFVSHTLELIIEDLRQRVKTDPLIKKVCQLIKVCQQMVALKSVRSSADLGVWLGGINGLELEEAEVDLTALKGVIQEIKKHLQRIEAK